MGRSSSAVKGGLRSAFSSVNSSTKKNTSSKKSSSSSSSRSTNSYSNNRSSRSYTVSSSNRSSYSTSSRNNSNLGYNLKKYMGQRGGTFGDKSYTKIGDDYYLKANPYSGVDMMTEDITGKTPREYAYEKFEVMLSDLIRSKGENVMTFDYIEKTDEKGNVYYELVINDEDREKIYKQIIDNLDSTIKDKPCKYLE